MKDKIYIFNLKKNFFKTNKNQKYSTVYKNSFLIFLMKFIKFIYVTIEYFYQLTN